MKPAKGLPLKHFCINKSKQERGKTKCFKNKINKTINYYFSNIYLNQRYEISNMRCNFAKVFEDNCDLTNL